MGLGQTNQALHIARDESIPAFIFQYGDIESELLIRTGVHICLMSTLDIVFMFTEAGEL